MNAVEFESVSKSYAIYDSPGDRLKELLSFGRCLRHRTFWALRDISFVIERGEVFCVIGENGAGKSTLLEIMAGISEPASGRVSTAGRVAALLELGSGFNPEYSGRDNVYLNAAVLGFSKREMEARYRQVEEFAEIGEFIDRPVKTYSSGMVVRLAFAVAIHTDPEILLVDEALSVGDGYFRQRCMRKVHELRSRGVTIVFVSHSIGDVKAIGDRVLWLDHGTVRGLGDTDSIVASYLETMAERDATYTRGPAAPGASVPATVEGVPNVDHRFGDGRAEVIGIAVLDSEGRPANLLEPGMHIAVRISARALQTLRSPVAGFTLRNHLGIDFAGTTTSREGIPLPTMQPGETCTVEFQLDLPELYPAFFSFSPAIGDGGLADGQICDWIDNAVTVQMSAGENPIYGYIHLPCRVEWNGEQPDQISEAAS